MMFQSLYIHWAEKFAEFETKEKDSGYFIIKGSVAMQLLVELYKQFLRDNDVKALEDLPVERKQKYWNIAKKYYTEKEHAILASKAAYTLDLISSNE